MFTNHSYSRILLISNNIKLSFPRSTTATATILPVILHFKAKTAISIMEKQILINFRAKFSPSRSSAASPDARRDLHWTGWDLLAVKIVTFGRFMSLPSVAVTAPTTWPFDFGGGSVVVGCSDNLDPHHSPALSPSIGPLKLRYFIINFPFGNATAQ